MVAPATVTVVRYDWRNWSVDVFAFEAREKAEAHVVEMADEYVDDFDPAEEGFDDALEALTSAGHTVSVDDVEVLR